MGHEGIRDLRHDHFLNSTCDIGDSVKGPSYCHFLLQVVCTYHRGAGDREEGRGHQHDQILLHTYTTRGKTHILLLTIFVGYEITFICLPSFAGRF